jgi:hypothetical protein
MPTIEKQLIIDLLKENVLLEENIKKLQEQLRSKDDEIATLCHELKSSTNLNFNY